MIAVTALLTLFALWCYTKFEAMAFMESGYGIWKAKETFIERCDFGSDVYLGDSQADAGIVPHRLSAASTNLALAGGTAIESNFFLRRILACPNPPRRVVLSFGLIALQVVQPFLWETAERYRTLGLTELRDVSTTADMLGDHSYARVETRDGTTGVLRDLIYGLHLPSIYFSALLEGRLFMRRSPNLARFSEVINSRGYPNYRQPAIANHERFSQFEKSFEALPLQVYYLDTMVNELEQRHIEVDFLITPIDRSEGIDLSAIGQYQAFLAKEQARYPSLHILQSDVPLWDSRMFVDGVHLNNAGAEKFTALLDGCLRSASATSGACRFASDEN